MPKGVDVETVNFHKEEHKQAREEATDKVEPVVNIGTLGKIPVSAGRSKNKEVTVGHLCSTVFLF